MEDVVIRMIRSVGRIDAFPFYARKLSPKGMWVPGGVTWGLLLTTFLGYATLNRGFAYIGSYPLFIGEITLIFYIATIRHSVVIPKFLKTVTGKAWLLFFLYNFVIFLLSSFHDLAESIRNSIYWFYSVYLYVGFAYGRKLVKTGGVKKFEKYLLIVAIANVVYLFSLPVRKIFINNTAFLYGNNSLVGYFSTYHAISIGFSFYILFYANKTKRKYIYHFVASIGILLSTFVTQSRASLLIFISFCLYISVYNISLFKQLIKIMFISIVVVVIMLSLNVSITGQKNSVSVEYISDSFVSIFNDETGGSHLQGSREDRLSWWWDIIERTTNNNTTLFFGLGHKEILVYRATGPHTIIRYPHNSFVSIFGFSGLIGFFLFMLLITTIIRQISFRKGILPYCTFLYWYPFFFIGFYVAAFFSTVLEAPFHSFIFWTLSGAALGIITKK